MLIAVAFCGEFIVDGCRDGVGHDQASRIVGEPLLGGRIEPVPLIPDVIPVNAFFLREPLRWEC